MTLSFTTPRRFYPGALSVLLRGHDIVWIDETGENWAVGKPSLDVLDGIDLSYKKPKLNVRRQRLLAETVIVLSVLLILSIYFGVRARQEANLALARQLAAQSQLVASSQPGNLERAVLLAVESTRREPLPEGDIALRNASRLLPRLTREQHSGRLRSDPLFRTVAVSTDRKLVAGAAGKRLTVYDGAITRELAHFDHMEEVLAVSFSPSGRRLPTASSDGTAKVIDTAALKPIYVLNHDEDVRAAVFSPDERLIATAGEDNLAIVWSVADGKAMARIHHPDWVEDVKFSPDSRLIATGGQDQKARVWSIFPVHLVAETDFERQGPKHAMIGGTLRTQTVAFSPDGRWFAASSLDGTVVVQETAKWKEVHRFPHIGAVSDLAFTPDSRHLIVALANSVAVWDLRSGRQVAELRHGGNIYGMSFSPKGAYLVTASQDRTAHVWDTGDWSEVFRAVTDNGVGGAAFLNENELLTAGDSLRLWNLATGRRKVLAERGYTAIAFSPRGDLLATTSEASARVWNTRDWTPKDLPFRFDGRAVAFSGDGKRLAFASRTGEVVTFDTGSWRSNEHKVHGAIVESVTLSPDGRFLASGSRDKTAIVWDNSENREAWRYRADDFVDSVSFSPDGGFLAIGSGLPAVGQSGKVVIVNWRTRTTAGALDTPADPEALSWSPDGRLLAAGLGSGWALIVKRREWNKVVATPGNHDVVRALLFSRTGRFLGSGGRDGTEGTARLWDTRTWSELSRLRLPSVVLGLAISPDETLFAASYFDRVQIDVVGPEDLIREACDHLTRPLTRDEWMQYLPGQPYRLSCAGPKP